MPRQDGTGPRGRGPVTGWGLGLCERDPDTDAYPVTGVGRGGIPRGGRRGRCFGGGGGQGRHGPRSLTGFPGTGRLPADDLDALRSRASLLEEQLQALKERLVALEGEAVEEKE